MGGAMACPRPYYPNCAYCEPGRGQAIAPPIFDEQSISPQNITQVGYFCLLLDVLCRCFAFQ
jgi:hypothetical protein